MKQNEGVSKRDDVYTKTSDRKGFAGLVETVLRRFNDLFHMAALVPLYTLACFSVGLATVPGFLLLRATFLQTRSWDLFLRLWLLGTAAAAAYLLYGFSIILVMPTINFLTHSKLKEWRGPYYSLPAIRWYIHNGATYIVRYTFLEFITPTPYSLWFFRLMGMKIGVGTIINTSHISDPSLIEIGEKVTLGGSVTIVGHYGQGGYLVLAPVKIGSKATIGLRAVIMGGCQIGDGAKILPNSVVMPKTIILPGETWGGVPAVKIQTESQNKRVA